MARQFKGEYVQKVDSKGRVSVPAAFRRVIENEDPDCQDGRDAQIVLVYGNPRNDFVEGYTMSAMAEVDEKIAAMPRGSKNRRMLEWMFSGQAVQLTINDAGQVVLGPKIKDKLNLRSEAYFVASGDTFQLWNAQEFEKQKGSLDNHLDSFPDDFDPLTLLDVPQDE